MLRAVVLLAIEASGSSGRGRIVEWLMGSQVTMLLALPLGLFLPEFLNYS